MNKIEHYFSELYRIARKKRQKIDRDLVFMIFQYLYELLLAGRKVQF